MSLKQEFVALATKDGANRRELCRRFGISPTGGGKMRVRVRGDMTRKARHVSVKRPSCLHAGAAHAAK